MYASEAQAARDKAGVVKEVKRHGGGARNPCTHTVAGSSAVPF